LSVSDLTTSNSDHEAQFPVQANSRFLHKGSGDEGACVAGLIGWLGRQGRGVATEYQGERALTAYFGGTPWLQRVKSDFVAFHTRKDENAGLGPRLKRLFAGIKGVCTLKLKGVSGYAAQDH
jgi:hypothetical protein